jgi:hypothetical protein
VSVTNPLIGRVTAEVRRARVAPRTRGLAVGFALLPLLAACEFTTPTRPAADKRAVAFARAEAARLKRACGSQAGYDRLKSMTFVEAARIRKADSPALKRLASLSVVRMDQPVARSRDAALGVTAGRRAPVRRRPAARGERGICRAGRRRRVRPRLSDAGRRADRLSACRRRAARARTRAPRRTHGHGSGSRTATACACACARCRRAGARRGRDAHAGSGSGFRQA